MSELNESLENQQVHREGAESEMESSAENNCQELNCESIETHYSQSPEPECFESLVNSDFPLDRLSQRDQDWLVAVRAVSRKLDEANLELTNTRAKLESLDRTLAETRKDLEEKEANLAQLEASMSKKTLVLDEMKSQMGEVESLVSIKCEIINDLEQQLEAQKAINKTQESELMEKNRRISILQGKLDENQEKKLEMVEEDELDIPVTPRSKAFPRESIGQWSENVSVRSLIRSMEKTKRPR